MQAAGALVLQESLRTSHGPSWFANAGRPARTGMIRRILLTKSQYFPVPPRLKPVNSPAESRAPVVAGIVARSTQRPGRAPHQTEAELRQRPGLTPVVAGNAPAEPR
ncbi:hypothetical protein DPMN_158219 [Dreissena polymorpha]|uniref:Uncharacterized protein n=1 Tax=Dreissena polymorpha TaxID=45954 RepID=A0A9D4ELX7_DREPO|nr:hypothetical protein DPMN_158219 [Dreissena polymorpha]